MLPGIVLSQEEVFYFEPNFIFQRKSIFKFLRINIRRISVIGLADPFDASLPPALAVKYRHSVPPTEAPPIPVPFDAKGAVFPTSADSVLVKLLENPRAPRVVPN